MVECCTMPTIPQPHVFAPLYHIQSLEYTISKRHEHVDVTDKGCIYAAQWIHPLTQDPCIIGSSVLSQLNKMRPLIYCYKSKQHYNKTLR